MQRWLRALAHFHAESVELGNVRNQKQVCGKPGNSRMKLLYIAMNWLTSLMCNNPHMYYQYHSLVHHILYPIVAVTGFPTSKEPYHLQATGGINMFLVQTCWVLLYRARPWKSRIMGEPLWTTPARAVVLWVDGFWACPHDCPWMVWVHGQSFPKWTLRYGDGMG